MLWGLVDCKDNDYFRKIQIIICIFAQLFVIL